MRVPAWSGRSAQPEGAWQWGRWTFCSFIYSSVLQKINSHYHPATDPCLLHVLPAMSEQYGPLGANTWNFHLSLKVYFCVIRLVKQSGFTQLKKLCLNRLVGATLWFLKICFNKKIPALLSKKYFKGHKQWLTLAKKTNVTIMLPAEGTWPTPTLWDAGAGMSVFHSLCTIQIKRLTFLYSNKHILKGNSASRS